METLSLRRRIPLAPKYFNSNIKTHIYNKLKNSLDNKCTHASGYVVSVDPNIQITESTINIHGQGLFEVLYNIKTLKPKAGQILDGIVCMNIHEGVLIMVHDKMKVLIPPERLGKYEFDEDREVYTYKKKTIEKGDSVSVKIELVRYENNAYKCIGSLVKR